MTEGHKQFAAWVGGRPLRLCAKELGYSHESIRKWHSGECAPNAPVRFDLERRIGIPAQAWDPKRKRKAS